MVAIVHATEALLAAAQAVERAVDQHRHHRQDRDGHHDLEQREAARSLRASCGHLPGPAPGTPAPEPRLRNPGSERTGSAETRRNSCGRENRAAHRASHVLRDDQIATAKSFLPVDRDGHLADARFEHGLQHRINERHGKRFDAGRATSRSVAAQRCSQSAQAAVGRNAPRIQGQLADRSQRPSGGSGCSARSGRSELRGFGLRKLDALDLPGATHALLGVIFATRTVVVLVDLGVSELDAAALRFRSSGTARARWRCWCAGHRCRPSRALPAPRGSR